MLGIKIISFFIALQVINSESPSGIDSPHATVTKGAFMYQRKDIILFNDFHPVNIVVDLPKYEINRTKIPCLGNELLCRGYGHVFEVQNTLADEVFESNPYVTGTIKETGGISRPVRGLINVVGYINKFLFGLATTDDIDALHGDIGRMAIKMNEMVTSSQRYMFEVVSNVSAYSTKLTELVASGEKKYQELMNKQNKGDVIFMEIINLIVVSLHLQSVSQMMHIAASDCRNDLIPRSIIPDTVMDKKLQTLRVELLKHNYVLTASLNQLLKLKIARCIFSKDKVEVTIKIPVKREGLELKLYQVLHTPYNFQGQQCVLDMEFSYVVQVNNEMVPITSDMQSYCNPEKEKLCLIADNSYSPSSFSSCAKALIGSSQQEIVSTCIMKCGPVTGTWITQLSSTEFAVTNSVNIAVLCDKKNKTYQLEPVGAVLLTLGCGCSATIRDDHNGRDIIIKPSYPCISSNSYDQHTITVILPPQMSNLRNAIYEENSESYSNVSDIVNEDWQVELPVLKIDPPKPVQFSNGFITNQLSYSFSYSTSIIYVWLALLTAGFIALGAMLMMSNGRGASNGLGMLPYLMICSPTFGLCSEFRAQKTVTFNDSIWALVQALEIMNVICWAVVMVFVILVLLFMHKSMKNVRICNRLLRAYEDGNIF